MYLQDYLWFLGAILFCAIFSGIASSKVKRAFAKNDRLPCHTGLTGYDTVIRLMQANGIRDISVGHVNGTLSDHYHPTKKIINLSDSTYASRSVAAVAVAAHEMGHVMQKKKGYLFYQIRTALVPVVNFGMGLSMPLVLIGLLLDIFVATANENTGFYIAMIGVVLYGGALLFALVTLPVELNASKRAKKMLLDEGILTHDEMDGASEVLSAAAMTYLASLLTSLVYFLRFLLYVLTIFGRRDRR
ncbi:MAG: zinc metallopeptidase [Ruminococcaceae bacterium]|nr:zinc metallopeptidase [Oscillospiraceae bacterium]